MFVTARGKGGIKNGETPDEYFEKFAHKDTKKTSKPTPKKGGKKNKRKITDEDYEIEDETEEIKEMEDCIQ